MYVGITRAKEKLFLTHAKQRKVWGNYQTNPRSRFIDEIPFSLIEEETGQNSSSPKSSFSSTVSRIREKKNSSYENKKEFSNSSSSSLPTNFASSLARIKQSAQKLKETKETTPDYRTVNAKVIKKNTTKQESAEQKTDIKSMIEKAKQKAKTPPPATSNRQIGLLPVGARVFHSSFGIGIIKEISSSNYVVDFTKAGKKTLDAMTSGLKTF